VAAWPERITVHNYPEFVYQMPDLKVMLVFASSDHVQAPRTKPHIHQAWDGFRNTGKLWVRMNPDLVYVQAINPAYETGIPDNPANEEPDDWQDIESWGFSASPLPVVRKDIWLASVAEMADRVHFDDWSEDLTEVLIGTSTRADEDKFEKPADKHELFQNYPNPFTSETTIRFRISTPGPVTLKIYDLLGKTVATPIDRSMSAGTHTLTFSGDQFSPGVYFYQIKTGNRVHTKKCLKAR
jgi:hypothetical protein